MAKEFDHIECECEISDRPDRQFLISTSPADGIQILNRSDNHKRRLIVHDFLKVKKNSKFLIQRLSPKSKDSASSTNSLSSRYGLGDFPPHSDFVSMSQPPRWIAIFCPVTRPAVTKFIDCSELFRSADRLCDDALFRVRSKRQVFSASFRTLYKNGFIFRYNQDLMEPLNSAAISVQETIKYCKNFKHEIDWRNVSLVIFDNWRFLHSRGEVNCEKSGWLWRIAKLEDG